jgi:hypothetical protein
MCSLLEKSLNFNSKIKINFEGGDLTSDAGLLLYKEFDEKIGFSKTIKENLYVEDISADARFHKNEDIAIQRIYQKIGGYTTDDHADELRSDPTFINILSKSILASQPTISRYNSRVSVGTLKSWEIINQLPQDNVYAIRPIEHILFDIDSTNFQTYGDQYGSDYNSHYASNGYHPLLMFDGLTGDLIKEGKLGLSFDKMSSTDFIANANKLQEMVLAYNFNNWFRNLCLDKTFMKSMTIETIRTKLIKVAAKIVKGGRYLTFKLCSSFPYKQVFWAILDNISLLPLLE